MRIRYFVFFFFLLSIAACKSNPKEQQITKNLSIFFINDPHGQIENFSKIKAIVDQEALKTNVILACSGDLFSGNPIVDNYPEKGYPMIDLMNKVGFDIAALGNHEFDYGETVLKNRMEQANFDWVCANVNMTNSVVPEPYEYQTLSVGDLKITFLGLVETGGKAGDVIPSTHPWKVQNFIFEKAKDVVYKYADIKAKENADLFVVLSHLGYDNGYSLGDIQLAEQFPYFDLIIGGHSHQKVNTTVNEIPIFQAGSYLNYLGKIELTVKNKKIETLNWDLIDLNAAVDYDADIKALIDEYNNLPYLKDVIGYSVINHSSSQIGCFLADAYRTQMHVDVSFQNSGGVRAGLNQGDITRREIFEITPFNNGTIIYEMSVSAIKNFLKGSHAGFYYSGIQIEQQQNEILISDLSNRILPDQSILSVGVIDYLPAVYDQYFPSTGNIQAQNDVETIISYLVEVDNQVNYPSCTHYFRYQ
ncbi:MAG: bifunctional metallophosphatase/5'-nucleotidase [Bacteroidales bacterium]|nr:bifunctional metallophosphatase/5'-nucleotidase [Bacteroidales bacterium]